jgi:phosphoribosylamine-glycine ligase
MKYFELATREGRATGGQPIRLRDGACVAVVLASAGYPERKPAPAPIEGLERVYAQGLLTPQPRADGQPGWDPPAVQVCFAGVGVAGALLPPDSSATGDGRTTGDDSADGDACATPWELPLLATGGRVLCISARAADLSLARRLAYEVAGNLHFAGMQLRTDIGKLR